MITITYEHDFKNISDINIIVDSHRLKFFLSTLTADDLKKLDTIESFDVLSVSEKLHALYRIAELYETEQQLLSGSQDDENESNKH
jgi:hypothetical protein